MSGGEIVSENSTRVENAVNTYGDSLMKIAYGYTQNMQDAQDLVQDAFVKYMTKAPVFLSSEHEKAWLIRITVNICKNYLASFHRKKRADLEESLPVQDTYSSELYDAVMKLPKKLSVAIHLYYYEGYSEKEISKILGITESAVASRLSRGREKLKIMIGDEAT